MDASVNFNRTGSSLQGTSSWYSFKSAKEFVVTQTNELIQTTCDIAEETFSYYQPQQDHPPSFVSSGFFALKAVAYLKIGFCLKTSSIFLSLFGFDKISERANRYSEIALEGSSINMQEAKLCFPVQFKKEQSSFMSRLPFFRASTLEDKVIKLSSDLFKSFKNFYSTTVKGPVNGFMCSVTKHPYFSNSPIPSRLDLNDYAFSMF